MSEFEKDSEKLLQRVWPDGMPERDRIIWEGLLPESRQAVFRRLDAVWRAENGEPWKPLADSIDLGRSAFFNLRRLWRENSLEGIVPYARQTPRRVATSDDAPVKSLARAILDDDQMNSRNVDLARRLLDCAEEKDVSGASDQARLQWAERLIRHERRALASSPNWLRKNWGRRIVVDLTAVSIVLKGQSQLAVVAVCLDAASGLVLGSAIGRLKDSLELERAAIDEAWRFVRERKADRDPENYPPCDLSLMLPARCDTDRAARTLKSEAGSLELSVPGTYAFGQRLVQIVGPKLGRVNFAPRKTLSILTQQFAKSREILELEPPSATSYWTREVWRHNEPVLTAIKKADVLSDGYDDGRLSSLFYALDLALRDCSASTS